MRKLNDCIRILNECNKIKDVFPNLELPAFKAYIENGFGDVWYEKNGSANSFKLLSGSFAYLFGEPSLNILRHWPSNLKTKKITLVPLTEQWKKLIISLKTDRIQYKHRYKTTLHKLNTDAIATSIYHLPFEIELRNIDSAIFQKLANADWSKNSFLLYPNYGRFKKFGNGFVAIKNGEIICCATTYFLFSKTIEVAVATKENFRNLGLATICAGKLILENEKNGFYSNWDATSLNSLRVANKLGYVLSEQYDAFYLFI